MATVKQKNNPGVIKAPAKKAVVKKAPAKPKAPQKGKAVAKPKAPKKGKAPAKTKAKHILTHDQKVMIEKKMAALEKSLLTNYKKAVDLSGKNWKVESERYQRLAKIESNKVKKKIEDEVRKNPAGAAVATVAISAVAAAFLLRLFKK